MAVQRIKRTLSGNLTLTLQIALVTHNHHGKIVLVFDAEDLLLECCNLLEALAGCDGVHEQETLASPHVLLSHSRVFLLTGGIENIEQSHLIVNDTLLAVRVWKNKSVGLACAWRRL